MITIMLIVVADVAMRYMFNSPIIGVSELVGLYLMVLLFFFAMSAAFTNDAHIRVDLLLPLMSHRVRRVSEAICCAMSVPVFALIAIPSGRSAFDAWERGDVLAGLIPWPTWIPPAIVTIGCWLLAARLAFNAFAHVLRLLGGETVVPLPTISGHEGSGA